MSILKLRTLTLKSKIGFGRYEFQTVQELFNRGNLSYLSYIYYNYSNITFNEEVLNKLFLFDDLRITKPGKNPEKYNPQIGMRKNSLSQFKHINHMKKEIKTSIKTGMRSRESKWFNKSANAWKNQGH